MGPQKHKARKKKSMKTVNESLASVEIQERAFVCQEVEKQNSSPDLRRSH